MTHLSPSLLYVERKNLMSILAKDRMALQQSCHNVAGIQPAHEQYYRDIHLLDRLSEREMQVCLRKEYPDATVREALQDTVASSRDKIQGIRKRLELCHDVASLGKIWKETERLVKSEAHGVATHFRTLRTYPALRVLIDFAEEQDAEWTIAQKFPIDAYRSQPILFCLDMEGCLHGITASIQSLPPHRPIDGNAEVIAADENLIGTGNIS